MRHDPALAQLVRYWERLTPADVERLHEVYADDAYFRDPFNEVRGVEAIKPVFRHMFETLHEPRFTILETVAAEGGVFLVWDFDFRIQSLQPARARRIHGTSHIRFAPDGRVAYHRDYWDAAGELYEGLPVIGGLMRMLGKRMRAEGSTMRHAERRPLSFPTSLLHLFVQREPRHVAVAGGLPAPVVEPVHGSVRRPGHAASVGDGAP